MKITLCGSITCSDAMIDIEKQLVAIGFEVERPIPADDTAPDKRSKLIAEHFTKIDSSDAILVVNLDKNGVKNYVGPSVLMEMAHAFAQRLEIFFWNPVPDMQYTEEMLAMNPIIIYQDVASIYNYP